MFGLTLGLSTRLPRAGPGVVWSIDLNFSAEPIRTSGGDLSVDGDNDIAFSAEAVLTNGGALAITEIINLDVGDPAEPVIVAEGVLVTSESIFFNADPVVTSGGEVTVPGAAVGIALSGDAGPGRIILSGDAGPGALLVTFLTETVSLTAEVVETAEGTLEAVLNAPVGLSGDAGPGRIKLSGDAQVSGSDVLLTRETL